MQRFIGAMALAMALPVQAQVKESAFNPAISLILQGTVARSTLEPETYRIDGFAPSGGEVGPPRRGFSLGESELTVAGNIDPYLRGQLVAALTPEDEVEVEEAFIQTLVLGRGFTAKAGRFLSGIGYLNEIHQHAWDFADAPLAYKAFLGGRFNDDALQVRWIAPTELFVELGAEAGRGRAFPASDFEKNGAGAAAAFARVGGDIGAAAWRAGLSFLHASPVERLVEENTTTFSGDSRLWIVDAVVKWGKTFKVQAEYFRRKESGTLDFDDGTQAFSGGYTSRQSGAYAQAVWQLVPRWRVGYRYDRLDHGSVSNEVPATFPVLMAEHDPARHTVMLDWNPSEFSRLRLQLARDNSRADATDNQVLLQYIVSLGAHGAHRF
jgi:hypothetical protein